MKKNSLVSIIIPTYNRREKLKHCLRSIFQQNYLNKEVIVVDNDSKDGTIDMLVKDFPEVKVIKNPFNRGAAYAKNQGVVKCHGEFVWFLDSDSIVLNHSCLSSMVYLWRKYKDIGALGGEVILDSKNRVIGMRCYDFYRNGMSFIKDYYTKSDNMEKKVGFLPTFNLFTAKKIIYQVKGFDFHYFYLAEDKELCFKIRRLDYQIISNIKTSILHNRKELYSQRLKKKKYLYNLHKNRIRFVVINQGLKEVFQLPISDFIINKGFVIKSFVDMFVLTLAYLRNIVFLPRELLIKFTKPNFLTKIK